MTATDLDRWAADQAAYGSPDYVRGYRDGIADAVAAAKDFGEARPVLAWTIIWRHEPLGRWCDDGVISTDETLARERFAQQVRLYPRMEQHLCAITAVTP